MNAYGRSYECEEINSCDMCEDPCCACDCHDYQEFSAFFGWVPLDDEDER